MLQHGDWLGLITPESNISLRVFHTSFSMGRGILGNLFLYGSRSVKLIVCSIMLMHPNMFSRANISWYSIRSSLDALPNSLSQALSPERSNFCIILFLNSEMDIFGLLMPYISSSASIVPGLRCKLEISLAATTLAKATPLFKTTAFLVVFLTTTKTLLLPSLKSV